MSNPFTRHPNAVGETYLFHAYVSFQYALFALTAAVIFVIHAVFPFLFQTDGVSILKHVVEDRLRRKDTQ